MVSQVFFIVADKTLACTSGQKEVSCANVVHVVSPRNPRWPFLSLKRMSLRTCKLANWRSHSGLRTWEVKLGKVLANESASVPSLSPEYDARLWGFIEIFSFLLGHLRFARLHYPPLIRHNSYSRSPYIRIVPRSAWHFHSMARVSVASLHGDNGEGVFVFANSQTLGTLYISI